MKTSNIEDDIESILEAARGNIKPHRKAGTSEYQITLLGWYIPSSDLCQPRMPYPAKLSAIIEGNSRVFYEKRHRRNVWPPRQLCWKEKKIHPLGHRKERTTVEQYLAREEGRRKHNSNHYEGDESRGSMHSSQWWLWMFMHSGLQKTQTSRQEQKAGTFLLPPKQFTSLWKAETTFRKNITKMLILFQAKGTKNQSCFSNIW